MDCGFKRRRGADEATVVFLGGVQTTRTELVSDILTELARTRSGFGGDVEVVLHQTSGFATLHGAGSHRAAAELEGRLEGACLAEIKRNKTDWYCPFCAAFQANQKGDPRDACTSCGQPRPATLRAAAEAAEAVSRGPARPARPLEPGSSAGLARSLGLPFLCSPTGAAPGARASRERDAAQFAPPNGRGAGTSSGTDGTAACCPEEHAATAVPMSPWRHDQWRLQASVQPREAPGQRCPLSSRHTPPPPHPQVWARPALGRPALPAHPAPRAVAGGASRDHPRPPSIPPRQQVERCVPPPRVEPLQTIHHARLVEAELTCARLNPYRIWAEDVSEQNGAKRYACTSVEGMAVELASAGVHAGRCLRERSGVGEAWAFPGACDRVAAPRGSGGEQGRVRLCKAPASGGAPTDAHPFPSLLPTLGASPARSRPWRAVELVRSHRRGPHLLGVLRLGV